MSLEIDTELPLRNPPSVAWWAENYVFEVNAHEDGFSFLMHLGRQPYDLALWREIFIADFGGDDVYAYRGFGRGNFGQGPGGSQLRFICHEPFKRWQLVFDGAAQRVSRKSLGFTAGQGVPQGPILPFRMHLFLEAEAPIWDVSKAHVAHDLGDAHYQQHMRLVSGQALIGERIVEIRRGTAMRDHTRGPRNLEGIGSWAWVHGGMPGGKHFCALILDQRADQRGHRPSFSAVVWDGKQLNDVRVVETDAIPRTGEAPPSDYTLVLEGPAGIETIKGQHMAQPVVVAIGAPNDFILGQARGPSIRVDLCGTPTSFVWNGEPCFGYSEQGSEVAVKP